jgi:hypothetical protein
MYCLVCPCVSFQIQVSDEGIILYSARNLRSGLEPRGLETTKPKEGLKPRVTLPRDLVIYPSLNLAVCD